MMPQMIARPGLAPMKETAASKVIMQMYGQVRTFILFLGNHLVQFFLSLVVHAYVRLSLREYIKFVLESGFLCK
jgi:hypothetical protein